MSYAIPIDVQHRIEVQLASGRFSGPDEVLREAIEALERRQQGLVALRAMVAVADEDVAASRVAPLDRESVQSEVRERLAAKGIQE